MTKVKAKKSPKKPKPTFSVKLKSLKELPMKLYAR